MNQGRRGIQIEYGTPLEYTINQYRIQTFYMKSSSALEENISSICSNMSISRGYFKLSVGR